MTNLPTLLTLFRIAMGPVIAGVVLWAVSVQYVDRLLAGFLYGACLVMFLLAAATDWLDGWLARRWNAVTPMGAALDHAADKVLITCVLVALAYAALPLMLVVAAMLILGRDVAIAGLREAIAAQGKTLPVSALGKWKAAAEMGAVAVFLSLQTAALLLAPAELVLGLYWAAQTLFWSAVALALISAAGYAGALLKA
ncbi:MAG: CDP-diacylglycerol--glycerol-3-phosphate 3-phosphatidyltransferase [Hyphomonadaceae bacterium]|nr:CDP-diacylglycerol--glycerol-3-phosphate 3-phosphatidyltransferase [Hyphomonadaceae bacterium]